MLNRLLVVIIGVVLALSVSGQEAHLSQRTAAIPGMQQPQTEDQNRTRLRSLVGSTNWYHDDRDAARIMVNAHGPVVLGMPFSELHQRELLRLLTMRWAAVRDTRNAFFRKSDTQHRIDPALAGPSQHEINDAVTKATAGTDAEINALVGPEWAAQVTQMIEVEIELSGIATGYAASLDTLECPLSPEQRLSLARSLHWLAQSRNDWIRQNNRDAARRDELQPINAAGVTESEESSLKMMQAGGLSNAQIEAMRTGFIFTERKIHKIPIEWERGCDIPADAEKLIAKAGGEDGPRFGRIAVFLYGTGKAKLKRSHDDRVFCAVMYESHP